MKSLGPSSRPEPQKGTVHIESSVAVIESECFKNYQSLEEAIFANDLKVLRIGEKAFRETGLKRITIPRVKLRIYAFVGALLLKKSSLPMSQNFAALVFRYLAIVV